MNDTLSSLLNLIDDSTSVSSEKDTQILTKSCKKTPKKLLTKIKEDKNVIKMVYGEDSPVFMIKCGVCKRENTWKESARVGWVCLIKERRYVCPNCT